jgi:hypothetical protein
VHLVIETLPIKDDRTTDQWTQQSGWQANEAIRDSRLYPVAERQRSAHGTELTTQIRLSAESERRSRLVGDLIAEQGTWMHDFQWRDDAR